VVKDLLGFKISKEGSAQEWDLMWTDNAVHPETLARMKPYQKINHFPGMFSLSRKNYLARNLIKMSKAFPHDYDFYPKTWVLPSELNDLRQYMEEEQGAVVIAKPEASCQGRGIFLSKNIEDFSFGVHYVVQKYLKKPLLIDGLKFDLRVYVLVAGCDPLRVYIYREGLARFATEGNSASTQPTARPRRRT
jgi:tubulin polyglutamylase TTLL6/13